MKCWVFINHTYFINWIPADAFHGSLATTYNRIQNAKKHLRKYFYNAINLIQHSQNPYRRITQHLSHFGIDTRKKKEKPNLFAVYRLFISKDSLLILLHKVIEHTSEENNSNNNYKKQHKKKGTFNKLKSNL